MPAYRYFTVAGLFTIVGLGLGFWLGYADGGMEEALSVFFICSVLAVLEISLSFDNAIVNAKILEGMAPKWQRRFLTWGIVIAVFGMRIIFPLAIVAIAARIDPISAVVMAATDPARYATIMNEAHVGIAAFGGTFLMMVGLKYFFDSDKQVHWIGAVEKWLSRFATVQGVEIAVVVALVLFFAARQPDAQIVTFLTASLWGLLVFLAVEGIGKALDASQSQMDAAHKAGFGAFLYLEILDASFSFDGVIGAFALSSNLFVIAIGLGIGAFYVRSLTIMLVDRKTLVEYRYLEHGAFYAILILAVIMMAQTLVHIPEVITGLIGAALILMSFLSSVAFNRRNGTAAVAGEH